MRKTIKRVMCLMLTTAMILGGSSIDRMGNVLEAWAADETEAVETLQLAGYKKLGDTIVVENATEGAQCVWTVTSQITGEIVYTETNNTGTFATSDEYDECMITCEVDGETLYTYCSALPVMYIDSETEYGSVLKEEYSDVNMKLVGSELFDDEDLWYDGEAEIKLRGNSTAYRPKSPYRVKLKNKADLLGLGKGEKSKHWVLLANDIDHSLIRNKLLYDFSGAIGTEFYFDSTFISVIYNGEYIGVYQLCEHRRVDEGRIDITDWVGVGEDAAEAIAEVEYEAAGYSKAGKMEDALNEVMYQDYSWMDSGEVILGGKTYKFADYGIELPTSDGGYLAEMDFYSMGSNEVASLETAYGQPLYFSAPEAGSDAEDIVAGVQSFKETDLFNYALKYTQSFEYALHSADFIFESGTHKQLSKGYGDNHYSSGDGWTSVTNDVSYTDTENEGKHYSELFDMDSLVTNFIFVEYAMNWDSMKNSFFYYKDHDELAKIGPQWDFDWAWGNNNMYGINTWYPTSWQTTIEWFTNEQAYQSYNWNRLLIKDPYFLVRAYEKYHNVRDIIEEMIKEGGTIDQYEEYLVNAGMANDTRWSYTYYDPQWYAWGSDDFYSSIWMLENFVNTRVEWLDKQFASIDNLVNSLGYYKEAADIDLDTDITADGNVVTAITSNAACKKVAFQVNGTYMVEADVVNGVATANIPADALIYDGITMNVVVAYEMDANGYILNTDLKPSGNYEYIAKSAYTVFVRDEAGLVGEQPKTGEFETETIIAAGSNTEEHVLVGDGSITFEVELPNGQDFGYLWAEVRDENGTYITTESYGNAWYWYNGGGVEEGFEYKDWLGYFMAGNTYRITMTREGQKFTFDFYDVTDDYLASIVATPPGFEIGNKISFYLMAREYPFKLVSDEVVCLETIDIALDKDVYVSNGNEIKPVITVKDADGNLVDPSNYVVKYFNNVKAGVGAVWVEGIEANGYVGSAVKTFVIEQGEEESTTKPEEETTTKKDAEDETTTSKDDSNSGNNETTGSATGTLTPNTGDGFNPLWIVVFIAAGAALTVLRCRKKKEGYGDTNN